MATEQHINAKFSFFIIFMWPVSKYIMSVVEAVSGHKIQAQMKTKASLTAMKAERNAFGLPAYIRLVLTLLLYFPVYKSTLHFYYKIEILTV